jgi:hypothetical protein
MDQFRYFVPNQEWTVLNFTVEAGEELDEATNRSFSKLEFKLVIERKPLYYILTLILPTIIITEMTCLGTFTKSGGCGERYEKITLGLTGVLSLSVYLLMISNMVPKTSLAVPMIGK